MSTLILSCRENSEDVLAAEFASKCGKALSLRKSPGLLIAEAAGGEVPEKPFVFERQRLENAVFVREGNLRIMSRDVVKNILPEITRSERNWTMHVFPPEDSSLYLSPKIKYFRKNLIDFCREHFGRVARRFVPEADLGETGMLVLNICMMREGLWGAAMDSARLSDPRPGGCHRMIFDEDAPSRSFLKVEETLDLMRIKPVAGERVIDLGAAPGGWSYAFLKRGCRVTAVDNGPMKIRNLGSLPGKLTHVRADGLVYEPDGKMLPADWLVSDMLVATGKNFALIRNWLGGKRTRKFIINIKLPQVEPWPVVKSIEEWLDSKPYLKYSLRQLYHDRQEITLFGKIDSAG